MRPTPGVARGAGRAAESSGEPPSAGTGDERLGFGYSGGMVVASKQRWAWGYLIAVIASAAVAKNAPAVQ
jgi:hypothetical protein